MSGYVHMDATYWGHNWGIMLCIDDAIGKVLYLTFIKHEKTQSYVDAVEGVTAASYRIKGIVIDGKKGFMGQNAGYDVLSSPINTGMRDS